MIDEKRIIHMFFVVMFFNIVIVGGMLNIYAIATNGGRMPFRWEHPYESPTHFSFQENDEVIHYQLTDIYEINDYHISIGDFFMLFGTMGIKIILIIQIRSVVKAHDKEQRH